MCGGGGDLPYPRRCMGGGGGGDPPYPRRCQGGGEVVVTPPTLEGVRGGGGGDLP